MFIRVPVEKISRSKYGKLRDIIEDINSVVQKPAEVVMLTEDDRVLGMVVFTSNRLHYIYVHPEVRGSGVGSKLLRLFNQETTLPAAAVVAPENVDAITFLLKHGWLVHGKYKEHNSDKWCLRMTRTGSAPENNTHELETAIAEFMNNTPVFVSVAKSIY